MAEPKRLSYYLLDGLMNKLYETWRLFQDNFLQYLSAILLLALTLLAIAEVVRRYILGVSFEWQQDLVTFGIFSGIFLFFGISQARRANLRVAHYFYY